MNPQWKEVLVSLRTQIKQLRAEYNAALFRHRRSGVRYSEDCGLFIRAQSRLSYLVPLYRNLIALSQQVGVNARRSRGALRYQRKFEVLLQDLERALKYDYQNSRERYFGGVMPQVQLLVPNLENSPASWETCTVGQLIEQVIAKMSAERQEDLRNQAASRQAKQAFLVSLNDAQRVLLKAALTADARLRGAPVLVIDSRDI